MDTGASRLDFDLFGNERAPENASEVTPAGTLTLDVAAKTDAAVSLDSPEARWMRDYFSRAGVGAQTDAFVDAIAHWFENEKKWYPQGANPSFTNTLVTREKLQAVLAQADRKNAASDVPLLAPVIDSIGGDGLVIAESTRNGAFERLERLLRNMARGEILAASNIPHIMWEVRRIVGTQESAISGGVSFDTAASLRERSKKLAAQLSSDSARHGTY